ncbi:pentatricopeptide repeat-containing protein At2g17140 [Momordica charantia]|uniref:Pentatricopeptide repeat-containing protein At2g17140 n=1 Tax=Momordica charantia TaxID=3673 RepID=A0A6J1C3B0_MOMCH|nr:pentatricopeptide repeat-containing protein At2g17140 [Momordica charantia]XP_022135645.1 pentatricopeptide repeat-containing protein At2g17140 [Momordica charantia]XP_022135646.1 pentatricopeptide repeat-containing protein At2g17140 [Momordica charantia]XP_022135647.1 pentatricopeptide repeat-containing protein At2g17140 [Momordica charantia]
MDRATRLSKAIYLNSNNPKLAWLLFKRILSSPIAASSSFFKTSLQSLPAIARILITAKMHPEIDHLHQLLLSQHRDFAHPSGFSLVQSLAGSGLFESVISQFQSLRTRFPDDPPAISFYNFLFRCSLKESRVDFVIWLYKDMVVARVKPQTYTFNLLILALCEMGHLENAREVFDKMSEKGCEPNEFSLGILVRGYCRAGLHYRGIELLDELTSSGTLPNRVVYNTVISAVCGEGQTAEAEKLVERMRDAGLSPDIVTFNCRIAALCKSGQILEACRIFRDMQIDEELGLPQPNIVTYNLMLEGFCNEGMLEESKALFDSMKRSATFLSLESYNIWLLGLVRSGQLLEARLILNEMAEKSIKPNLYSYNILIYGLCKYGMFSDARSILGLMRESGLAPDTVTYSTLLHGYCCRGKIVKANYVLREMMQVGCFPNMYTCNILLHSLWKEGRASEAEELLQKMNERNYGLDNVTCNTMINGLCKTGNLDKAIEIVSGMWTHGSASLGNLGNSFIGLFDVGNSGKKCMPDSVTYATIISGLCKVGRIDEAKKKLLEMIGKGLSPDSLIFDTFIHSYCKQGKLSSAFRVLKEMEKKGCNKSLRTYNSLIEGLGSNQIFEIYGLMDEMRESGISPNIYTYNNIIRCLSEGGKVKDATSLLDEMLQKGIYPNVYTFRILIGAFLKACDFGAAQDLFEIALSLCGHKESLYSFMFNELLAGGETFKAKELFEAALDRSLALKNFLYKDLIERLCKDEKLDDASFILHKMMDKQYRFDHASFMPVIDGLGKRGNKHAADEFAEKMMEMASETDPSQHENKIIRRRSNNYDEGDWHKIVHRNDGSGIAQKALKRVLKGWGQGSITTLQPQKFSTHDYWDGDA